ncbi:MarR family winged helix-turn-helix transcriptional regulator [Chryseobacterium camelliae]|uniref:MarR family winged helix-turn-helix transcriptional regulator n=1 Tax=Chryseobacterium camelliae TaxID=1265445 RepID=UPI002860EB18|nr:MarR family transcriptional regulator [Chryseobacterium camelliae]MDR6515894.1 DNA-binding MarR family transcriptional regulator [Chryseobacterium camelliae]
MESPENLKLENQICFPLYVIAKEITGLYRPFLDELDITYPQYLVMMVLWEQDGMTVSCIGEKLYLDSGTLTPLLKRLEAKGLITRKRKKEDERVVEICVTEAGKQLKSRACSVPEKIIASTKVDPEDLIRLKESVQNIIKTLKE